MLESNEKEKKEAAFAKSIDALNKLRGKVKAFIFLVSTDEASKEKEDANLGLNSSYGKLEDLVTLYENISPDIKLAAEMKELVDILENVFEKNEESESEKKDGDK